MSVEENKAIIRRFFEEFLNTGDLAVADELCAADYVLYFPGGKIVEDRVEADRLGMLQQLGAISAAGGRARDYRGARQLAVDHAGGTFEAQIR
jgi:hypothetical protein